jgi:YVTN family beta-propeller protein
MSLSKPVGALPVFGVGSNSLRRLGALVLSGLLLTAGLLGVTASPANADSVTATITVGSLPTSVAVNPTGTFAYVTNFYDGTVSVIDLSSNTVTDTLVLEPLSGPVGVAVNPVGTFAYVSQTYSDSVYVFDLVTHLPVGLPIAVGDLGCCGDFGQWI